MPRGITQEQVSAAADELVAASERPTVEKIRALLGTGSPNTVSRMLDAWRGALAKRLEQMIVLPEMPADVGQAFTEVWRLATTHSSSLAQTSLAQEQQALSFSQASMAEERSVWETAVIESRELAESADQARNFAETRLADVHRLVEQQAAQLAELIQQRDALACSLGEISAEFNDHKTNASSEREGQLAHIKTVEDRAHTEVDRAREETKSLRAQLNRREREAVAAATRLETAIGSIVAAEHSVTKYAARAQTLEKQLERMDGLPAALLAAQRATLAATQREAKLLTKLNGMVTKVGKKPSVRRRKSTTGAV